MSPARTHRIASNRFAVKKVFFQIILYHIFAFSIVIISEKLLTSTMLLMVYVLQQDYSTGSKDDIVAACRVETASGNDQYIPCVSGIASGTWVLTAWDRPLTMGGKVTIVSTTGIN